MMNILKGFFSKLQRTGWAAFIAVLGGMFIVRGGRDIFIQQAGVLAWKLVLVGTAVMTAHFVRLQLFPYVDLSEIVEQQPRTAGNSIIFLGVCAIYAAIILSVTSGL